MFVKLSTVKGEEFTLNTTQIECFCSTKKGTLIVCSSGMDYEVTIGYEELNSLLEPNFITNKRYK